MYIGAMVYRLKVNERVAAVRSEARGSVLDYSGRIVAMPTERSVMVRFADGAIESKQAHPDFVQSMEKAIRVARVFRRAEPDLDPTEPNIAATLAGSPLEPDFFDIRRAAWVIRHSPADLEGGDR